MKPTIKTIVGPPGTGKTSYLLNIMEDEMKNGVYPEEIAFVSFTKKATREAIERAVDKFKLTEIDFPYIRTLHSLAFQELEMLAKEMMRKENYLEIGEQLGIEFSVKDSMEVDDRFFENMLYTGDKYAYLDGYARARGLTPEQVWDLLGEYELNWLEFERYTRAVSQYKEEHGLMDFSDLLDHPHKPLDVKVAIIDEAQDLSTLQWKFAMQVFANAERIYVAGDDDQAIYTWSGADVQRFLELKGEQIVLDKSHRVPRKIHEVAEGIASQITNRIPKKYLPTGEDGEVEYHTSLDHVDLSEGTWLLLVRNGYLMRNLMRLVREQGYVYSCRGSSIINKDHLRAITAWERWRRGHAIPTEDVEVIESYLEPALKSDWPDKIWHEVLVKIPESERDYYTSLLRRGEKITKQPRISLNTIHGVKGGEADNVLLISDISKKTFEGMQRNPDNEWRVWYVAATRAKKSLHILLPQTSTAVDL